mgnify:CR=1 FL=1
MADVLVFARSGRSNAEGAFATCHCLTLPASEPGYYFWRDRIDARADAAARSGSSPSRRRSPSARATSSTCCRSRCRASAISRSIARARSSFYPGADPWIAKLDTVMHELYHIDPELAGIRRIETRGRHLFGELPRSAVLRAGRRAWCTPTSRPSRRRRLRFPARRISPRSTRATAASSAPASATSRRSRSATSSGLAEQLPCESDAEGVKVEPLRVAQQPTRYTQDDLHVRQFMKETSRRLIRKRPVPRCDPSP